MKADTINCYLFTLAGWAVLPADVSDCARSSVGGAMHVALLLDHVLNAAGKLSICAHCVATKLAS